MKVGDWTKLVTLIIVNGGVIFLALYGIINEQGVIAVLSASLGYVFGNTHAVMTKRKVE